MDNNDYTVYCHTTPSGKRYIGITRQKPSRRWRSEGQGYIKSPAFYNAIKKYGWSNIKHEILFTGLTKEDAENKEIELIRIYKSDTPAHGYNIEHGGKTAGTISEDTKQKLRNANLGKKASEETKKKLSILSKKNFIKRPGFGGVGEGNPFYGHSHSEETKQKLRERNSGINSPWFGRKHTENEKFKIAEAHKKKVVKLSTDRKPIKIYNSIGEAANDNNVTLSAISKAIHRKNRSNGYYWAFYEQVTLGGAS